MIRIIEDAAEARLALRNRTVDRNEDTARVVAEIIADVRARGDDALLDSARRFDSPSVGSLRVSDEEFASADVSLEVAAAITTARTRIESFHRAQTQFLFGSGGIHDWEIDVCPDIPGTGKRGQRYLALSSAGVYVPGGQAVYPSSVLMNAIPAQVAGVPRVVVTTPVRREGTLHPAVLFALRELGIREVYRVGGAAAVAALALGTETIDPVDKIVGPGNRWVNEAKRQLWGQVGLDGYAGPSEVCVVVDETTNPRFAAADFLTQIEHAEDNVGVLIATARWILDAVLAEVDRQATGAARETTLRAAMANGSLAIVAQNLPAAIDLVNEMAPEHLSLAIARADDVRFQVQNAGCVLVGEWSPESAGDYAVGPSHTLPTARAARFGSPINVLDFVKVQSVIHMTAADLTVIGPVVETFGETEGLPIHAQGARVRTDLRG